MNKQINKMNQSSTSARTDSAEYPLDVALSLSFFINRNLSIAGKSISFNDGSKRIATS